MSSNMKVFIHSLAAVVIGGGISAVEPLVTHGFSASSGREFGSAFATGAVIALLGYLKQSPLLRVSPEAVPPAEVSK